MQCYNGVWIGVLSQIGILFRLHVTEFINTEDPDSDIASSTKVQNKPVTEVNKSKADTKHMSPAKVPGMAAALFWCTEGHRVLIWYTGSFS
jgi:hypothetical protein